MCATSNSSTTHYDEMDVFLYKVLSHSNQYSIIFGEMDAFCKTASFKLFHPHHAEYIMVFFSFRVYKTKKRMLGFYAHV